MKDAYLSIDLDFWKDMANSRSSSFFFNKVFELDVPITCVIEHEELLPDIKKVKKLRTLYNVDYHSDICEWQESEYTPYDGTWVNFVSGKTKADYKWVLPDLNCYYEDNGTCHSAADPFEDNKYTRWKSVEWTDSMKDINWNKIQRVGVCLSPLFVNIRSVRPVLKKLNINIEQTEALIAKQSKTHENRTRGVLSKL